jgi:hypothetical protein
MKRLTLTLLFIVLISGCTQSNLKFSTGGCDIPLNTMETWIYDAIWINETILKITAYTRTFCEGVEIIGDYSLENNNLYLGYATRKGEIQSSCTCSHKLIYEVNNLAKKDYSLLIGRIEDDKSTYKLYDPTFSSFGDIGILCIKEGGYCIDYTDYCGNGRPCIKEIYCKQEINYSDNPNFRNDCRGNASCCKS